MPNLTILPPPPETIPAPPAPTEEAVDELWASVVEAAHVTLVPDGEEEDLCV